MKKIKVENGLEFDAFEIADLKGNVRENVLIEHYNFLASLNECENEDGEMVIEDLEYDEDYIVEDIEVNGYLFQLSGDIYPITHFCGNHPKSGQHSIRIFDKEYACIIS